MRFGYLDESGTGNLAKEPYIVVAGVLLHGDKQWKPLETYLHDMATDLRPKGVDQSPPYHAVDLWHGTKGFHRDAWPRELRMEILRELASLPQKFMMPIAMGYVDRAKLGAKLAHLSLADQNMYGQSLAFIAAACLIEKYMRGAPPDQEEVAVLVAEDNAQVRRLIRDAQRFLRHPVSALLEGVVSDYVPFNRIVETVHFAEKIDSSPLQVADACAFIIRRHLQRLDDTDELYQLLVPRMLSRPRMDLADASPAPFS